MKKVYFLIIPVVVFFGLLAWGLAKAGDDGDLYEATQEQSLRPNVSLEEAIAALEEYWALRSLLTRDPIKLFREFNAEQVMELCGLADRRVILTHPYIPALFVPLQPIALRKIKERALARFNAPP